MPLQCLEITTHCNDDNAEGPPQSSALLFSAMAAESLLVCHIKTVRGSLIPLPPLEARETDQIKLQAMGFVVTLKILRATVILTNWIWWNAAITTATFPYIR